jgi:hypothetical protein
MVHTHAAEERFTYAVTSHNRRGVVSAFSVVRPALVAKQLCGKHISAAVKKHATLEEALFSVSPPRGYITRSPAARIRIESSLRSQQIDRIMVRKKLGGAKKTSCMRLVELLC